MAAQPTAAAFAPTIPNQAPAPGPAPEGMVWIPGGEFSMGCLTPSEGHCTTATMNSVKDSQPIHRVYVDGFWMDKTDVTNDEFDKFVRATGYKTIAEIAPTKEQFPTAPPENLVAGSTVFTPTKEPVPLNDHFQWWRYVHGANWRHPTGPDSDIKGQGKISGGANRLRRRGGLREVGRQAAADGSGMGIRRARRTLRQNVCVGRRVEARRQMDGEHLPRAVSGEGHGRGWFRGPRAGRDNFPQTATASTTWPATSGNGAATGIGPTLTRGSSWPAASAVVRNPQGPSASYNPGDDQPQRVHRGGSFLCTDQYCTRYMMGTRGKGDVDTGSNHLGFRCVKDGGPVAGKEQAAK